MLKKIDEKLKHLKIASANEYSSEKKLLKLNVKSGRSAYVSGIALIAFTPAVLPSLFKLIKNILYFAVSLTANILTLGLNKNLRGFCWKKLLSLVFNICNTVLSILLPLVRLPQTLINGYSVNIKNEDKKNKALQSDVEYRFFNTWYKPKNAPTDSNDHAAPINDVDRLVYNSLSCSN